MLFLGSCPRVSIQNVCDVMAVLCASERRDNYHNSEFKKVLAGTHLKIAEKCLNRAPESRKNKHFVKCTHLPS